MPVYALEDLSPILPEDGRYWVAPGAHVIGQVTLGRDCSIWFGAVLRGDNEPIDIGERTNIQENTVLHVDPGFPMKIGNDCTIGHNAILHGCAIGDATLVGMGTTIMNGVKIGAGCLIGANALITEGKQFPDNTLIVGSPAKAIRTLDSTAGGGFLREAAGYVNKAERYRQHLRALD
ncbi:MAG: gamma carbonic anhydrase family protein [Casimicrobiaceae bacterium]